MNRFFKIKFLFISGLFVAIFIGLVFSVSRKMAKEQMMLCNSLADNGLKESILDHERNKMEKIQTSEVLPNTNFKRKDLLLYFAFASECTFNEKKMTLVHYCVSADKYSGMGYRVYNKSLWYNNQGKWIMVPRDQWEVVIKNTEAKGRRIMNSRSR